MPYLLGTDEAGYGPNLGPLLVAATLWRLPERSFETDLYETLAEAVCNDPGACGRLAIADSKQLYKPGGGWAALELGVGAMLGVLAREADSWRRVWRALGAANEPELAAPWHDGFDLKLPRDAQPAPLAETTARVRQALAAAGVELLDYRAVAVFPSRFNQLVEELGNKATVLSHLTLSLAAELAAPLADEPLRIHCDKHGGRNKYAALLQHSFPDHFIEIQQESRDESIYRWGPRFRRCEARFTARGERFLPAALASMAAKYLRELAMLPFNQFWARHVPNLRPTAGYPQDAVRFRQEIDSARQRLGIEERLLWRTR